jgi:hypothetical protein
MRKGLGLADMEYERMLALQRFRERKFNNGRR